MMSQTAGNSQFSSHERSGGSDSCGGQHFPVITLNGDTSVTIILGDEYLEAGAVAGDETDGDITSEIIIAGDNVNTNAPGSYTVTYDISDAAGNAAIQLKRTVTVTVQNPWNSTDLGMGWKHSVWFSTYFDSGNNWIYHLDLGWLYRISENADSIWFWDDTLGWLWTNSNIYPMLYNLSSTSWIYYAEGTSNPGILHNLSKHGSVVRDAKSNDGPMNRKLLAP